jgi:polar amino acid transport system substrate-binding protein
MHEPARKRGVDNLDVSGDTNATARKFAVGSADYWLSLESLAIFSLKEEGYETDKAQVVDVINEFDIYIGGSPNLSEEDMKPWQNAFQAMKDDGTYDEIMARYGF